MTDPFFTLHDLPRAWRGRRNFVIVDTHFGDARAFLEAWTAWRADTARCERLHFVSAGSPGTLDRVPAAESGPLAALLADAWPMRVTGVHRLEFEAGRVVLTLAVGDVADVLQKLWLRADAFNLRVDPADDPRSVCKTLARVAGENATVVADRIRCCGARLKLPVLFAIRRRKKQKRPSPPASRRAGACGVTNHRSPSQHRTGTPS